VWLEDYMLTCNTWLATDDQFIIMNLSLYLTESARTWLEHLPRDKINSWAQLRETFIGNFQGTCA
jgi:alpha-mannosidase